MRQRHIGLLLMPTVRAASPADHVAIHELLSAAALPVSDLQATRIDFLVADADGAVVGAVGLQPFAPVGLVRSLVVAPEHLGTGLGAALLDAMERYAQAQGVSRLVLLTETAAPFFAGRGYVPADRTAMPDALQTTAEFRSLCPASAACLSKHLSRSWPVRPATSCSCAPATAPAASWPKP